MIVHPCFTFSVLKLEDDTRGYWPFCHISKYLPLKHWDIFSKKACSCNGVKRRLFYMLMSANKFSCIGDLQGCCGPMAWVEIMAARVQRRSRVRTPPGKDRIFCFSISLSSSGLCFTAI